MAALNSEHLPAVGPKVTSMMARSALPPAVISTLEQQAGVVGRAQLLAVGLSERTIERMLAGGWLTVLTPGIYGRGQTGWLGRAWAGVLLGGEHAVIGGRAAGHLHGLVKDAPSEIDVFTSRKLEPRPGWRFMRGVRKGRGEPPRTTVERFVLDSCRDGDEDAITSLVADVLSSRATTVAQLLAEARSIGNVPNRRLLREVLGDVGGGAHSALERRYLTQVERAHGLPEAKRQARVAGNHRSDAWYADLGVLVELDSKLHHSGAAAFDDMMRDNNAAVMGMMTLRLGWRQVTGVAACETARFVAQILVSRGWGGPVRACSRCAAAHAV